MNEKIGAGWKRMGNNNNEYISCQVKLNGNIYNFSLFKNNFKQSDKHPDYNILISNRRENGNKLELKEELDKIDNQIFNECKENYYQSRLKIYIGMWEKGKIVSLYRDVNKDISFRQLEKITERNDSYLKQWNDLYKKYFKINVDKSKQK